MGRIWLLLLYRFRYERARLAEEIAGRKFKTVCTATVKLGIIVLIVVAVHFWLKSLLDRHDVKTFHSLLRQNILMLTAILFLFRFIARMGEMQSLERRKNVAVLPFTYCEMYSVELASEMIQSCKLYLPVFVLTLLTAGASIGYSLSTILICGAGLLLVLAFYSSVMTFCMGVLGIFLRRSLFARRMALLIILFLLISGLSVLYFRRNIIFDPGFWEQNVDMVRRLPPSWPLDMVFSFSNGKFINFSGWLAAFGGLLTMLAGFSRIAYSFLPLEFDMPLLYNMFSSREG